MAESRKIFRQTVLSMLLPLFEAKGFELWKPKTRPEAQIIHLRRQSGDRFDLLDVQFEKHGRLGCFVNLAQVQGDQIGTQHEGVLPADQITTGHLSERCRLWGNSVFGMFKPPLYVRIFGPEKSGHSAATRIAAHFDEVEDWFASRRSGKHIRCHKL